MTNAIFLDPDRTEKYRPSTGSRQNGYSISPFEVPYEMDVSGDSATHGIISIRFVYPGGETGAVRKDLPVDLDHPGDVPVTLRSGRISGKILDMTFARPIDETDFARVASRLKTAAANSKVLSATFNYQMIAKILEFWREITSPQEAE